MIVRVGGKRLRVGGKTARSEDCCCGEEGTGCQICGVTDGPNTLTLTLAGVGIIAGCVACFEGADSMEFNSGTIDGTYTLTFAGSGTIANGCGVGDNLDYCDWTFVVDHPSVTIWQGSNDCGVTPSGGGPVTSATISSWTITARKWHCVGADTYWWQLTIEGTDSGVTAQIFVSTPVESVEDCDAGLPSIDNDANGACNLGTYHVGDGGTGVLSA